MDGILITILIVTGFLIYKLISSSRKQEGYKRWKATGSGNTTNEETSKNKWEHGAWLRHALGVVTPKTRTCPVFDEEAVVWVHVYVVWKTRTKVTCVFVKMVLYLI